MIITLLRGLLGIVVGAALGVAVVMGSDMLHHQLFPVPDGVDVTRPEGRAAMASLWPWQAFATMTLSWGLAAFAATATSGLIAGRGPWPAWIAGALMAAATGLNLLLVPHPFWVWPAAALALVIGIFAGARLGVRQSAV